MSTTETIAANIARFESVLADELARLGRSREEIVVVAVSKTFTAADVETAARAGLVNFGENRVQEAKEKIPKIQTGAKTTWHLVGHLQTNKAKDAISLFDLIQSVDRLDLAETLNQRAAPAGKKQDVLIQVNTTGEEQKSGCAPDELDDLVAVIAAMPHLRIRGLMTIGPFVVEHGPIAEAFAELRRLFDRLSGRDLGGGEMRWCSMGMSGDWRIALAEGANMLRVGTAIFGERGH